MKSKLRTHIAAAAGAIALNSTVIAQAPSDGIDLGALKPKTPSQSTQGAVGNVIGGSSTQNSSQKNANTIGTATTATAATPGGIGSSIKNPLAPKTGIGVVGGPAANNKGSQPTQDDASLTTDVQVKMPSNYKK